MIYYCYSERGGKMSKLKEIREQRLSESKRFTQEECAKVAGVSKPTYRKLEEHPEQVTIEQAERLAEHFGCSTGDIFLGLKGN